MKFVAAVVVACVSGAGCMDVADGRARRDAEIGYAETVGIAIRVDRGLARVAAIGPTNVALWLQAPIVSFQLTLPPGAPPVEIAADNAAWNAAMDATTPIAGLVIDPVPTPATPIPKQARWIVTPPAGGGTFVLRIAPADADAGGPFRFAVYGDVQEAIDRVQDIYRRMAEDPSIRFALIVGDLTEQGSVTELERFKRELAGLPFPAYATLGNHELGNREDLFHDHYGRGNQSFVFRNVQFTLLDTASATLSPMVYDWLSDWLVEGIDRPHFTFCHIPPLDSSGTRNGAFASRGEANKLLSLLASGHVDTTFYGHLHTFDAFSNAGIPAYISGGGGAIPERFDGTGRHFLTVDVDPDRQLSQVAVVPVD